MIRAGDEHEGVAKQRLAVEVPAVRGDEGDAELDRAGMDELGDLGGRVVEDPEHNGRMRAPEAPQGCRQGPGRDCLQAANGEPYLANPAALAQLFEGNRQILDHSLDLRQELE